MYQDQILEMSLVMRTIQTSDLEEIPKVGYIEREMLDRAPRKVAIAGDKSFVNRVFVQMIGLMLPHGSLKMIIS
jgi:hypothetical protein